MQERLAYIEKLEAQIDQAQKTLDRLKEDQKQAIEAGQHEEIERLEEHLDSAQVKLQDLRNAAGEAWQEVKEGVDELLRRLRESLSKLM